MWKYIKGANKTSDEGKLSPLEPKDIPANLWWLQLVSFWPISCIHSSPVPCLMESCDFGDCEKMTTSWIISLITFFLQIKGPRHGLDIQIVFFIPLSSELNDLVWGGTRTHLKTCFETESKFVTLKKLLQISPIYGNLTPWLLWISLLAWKGTQNYCE